MSILRVQTKNRLGAWLTPAAAFLLSAGLWTAALALFGMYPFGEHSILITDMGQQYIEYHAALYNAVKTGSGLLFTWNAGMGMNNVGLLAYYLASPFTLLIFLFERAALPDAVLLIISLKAATAGLTFSVYLRRAADVRGLVNILFSSLYALSAYTVVYCFNIMWLDAVMLLPLVILAARRIANGKSMIPFTAVLTLLFFSNFYTAYIVGLFSFLAFVAMLCLRPRPIHEWLGQALRFFASALLAAGLAACLLMPTYFALRGSQGDLSLELPFLSLLTDPLTLLGKMMWGAYDSVTNTGTAYLYCGVLTMGLMPVWLLHGGISRREKAVGSLLVAFLLISMMTDPLDVIWHACEVPVWFPCRYSFVYIFTVLTLASRALTRPSGLTHKRLLAGMTSAALLTLIIQLPEWISPDECNTMTGKLWITLGALVVYAAVLLLYTRKRRWLKAIGMAVLAVLVCAESVSNMVTSLQHLDKELHFEARESYAAYAQHSEELSSTLQQATQEMGDSFSDTNFYRVGNINERDPNEGSAVGYPAVSHYSSVSNRFTFRFLKYCGLVCTANNKILRFTGSTYALDSLLGVRYVFSADGDRAGYMDTGYAAGESKLYYNNTALPLAYFADAAALEVPISNSSPFELTNTLIRSLAGQTDKSYYNLLTVTPSCSGGTLYDNGKRIYIETDEGAEVRFTIQNPYYQHVMLYSNNNFSELTRVYLNGEMLNPKGNRLVRGVIDLGWQGPGNLTVSLYVGDSKRYFTSLQAVSFNTWSFNSTIDALRQHAAQDLTVKQTTNGGQLVSGWVDAPRDGVLFTSIPYDEGWSATIDGMAVDIDLVADAFIALPLTEGQHTFELTFYPQGLSAGIVVSLCTAVVCVVLLFVWAIRSLRRRRFPVRELAPAEHAQADDDSLPNVDKEEPQK